MSTSAPIWSELTAEEREYQYNPQRAFPDFADTRAELAPYNEAARGDLSVEADIAYGEHPLRRLDVYPAGGAGPRPVHVFLHGGYWRAQDKANFAFVAGTLVPRGITTVVANYELCPDSSLDGVVESARAALAWVRGYIADFGGAPEAVTLCGHSAGAHLGAAIIADEALAEAGPPLAGAVLASGIFDPAPAIGTTVNAELGLDVEMAGRNDFERRAPRMDTPVSLFAGGLEPEQWVDQSFRYYRMLRRHGRTPGLHVVPGRTHFDILKEYLAPDNLLVRTVVAQCGAAAEGRAA